MRLRDDSEFRSAVIAEHDRLTRTISAAAKTLDVEKPRLAALERLMKVYAMAVPK